MKPLPAIVSLFLSFALTLPLFSQDEPAVPKLSERLAKIAGHLGEGGVHFSVTDQEGDLEAVVDFLDELLPRLLEKEGQLPPGFKIKKLVRETGLLELQGSGSSCHQAGGQWHNRSFYLVDEKKGLLSIFGKKSSSWSAPAWAPASTALCLETEIDLRTAVRTGHRIASLFDQDEGWKEGLEQSVSSAGITLASLLNNLSIRASLAVWLDEKKTFEIPDAGEMPVPHFAVKIDRADFLWKTWGEEMMADSIVEKADGVITVLAPEEAIGDTPIGKLRPVVIYEEKTKTLWLALRPEDLKEARGGTEKLKTQADFVKAIKGLPDQGNMLGYVSPKVLPLVKSGVKMAAAGNLSDEEAKVFLKVVMGLLDKLDNGLGQAGVVCAVDEGFLIASNTVLPNKGSQMSGAGAVSSVAVLAGLAVPTILKVRIAGDLTRQTVNLRQLGIALLEYEEEHGKYPASLDEMLGKEIIPDEFLRILMQDIVYLPGNEDGDANTILAYTRLDYAGKVAYLCNDASVKQVPLAELRQLLQAQEAADE